MTMPGYTLERDQQGLTARHREVLVGVEKGLSVAKIAVEIGVTRQRAHQIVNELVNRGFVEKRGTKYVLAGKE